MVNQDLFSQRCSKLEVKDVQWHISRIHTSTTFNYMQQSGPFYLAIKAERHRDDETWYKAQPMGVNKINSMMKCIIAGTSLVTSEKRFSNHSARKTVVNKMKKASLERSAIAKVIQVIETCMQSLDDYGEADEVEQ